MNRLRRFITSLLFVDIQKNTFLSHYMCGELYKLGIKVHNKYEYKRYGTRIIILKNDYPLASEYGRKMSPITVSQALFLLNKKFEICITINPDVFSFSYTIFHKKIAIKTETNTDMTSIYKAADMGIYNAITMIKKNKLN